MKNITLMILAGMQFVSFSSFACDLHAKNDKANSSTITTSQAHDEDTANLKSASFYVKGMMCSSCAKKVKTSVQALNGVHWIQVDRKGNLAQVKYDPAATTPDAIVAAIKAAGYEAKAANPQL